MPNRSIRTGPVESLDRTSDEIPLVSSNEGQTSPNTEPENYGEAEGIMIVSAFDVLAIFISLVSMAIAILCICNAQAAVYLGLKYQLVALGLLLSTQSFCTSRQVLLSAVYYMGYRREASLQDFDSLLRKTPTSRGTSWPVRTILLAVVGLPILLSVLYKQFVYGSSSHSIPSFTGQFGIIPPSHLDDINGNGITLAVNQMTPFWRKRQMLPMHDIAFGENLLFVDENTTAILDTPMRENYKRLRNLLSEDRNRNQSLILSADVNATVATKVEITTGELKLFSGLFDEIKCTPSPSYWCAGLSNGWWAAMVFGGVEPDEYDPVASLAVNYLGIWRDKQNVEPSEKFSHVVQKFILTRQHAQGEWNIDKTSSKLRTASLNKSGTGAINQSLVSGKSLNLDLFGQLLQEYDYRKYDFGLTSPTASFMASIVWARLATLNIQDRSDQQRWLDHANYTKPMGSYNLRIQAQTVSRSTALALLFVVNPALVIVSTIIKAYLHRVPLSDGCNTISVLASASHSDLGMLKGAGYSGRLSKKIRLWFISTKTTDNSVSKVTMRLGGGESSEGNQATRLEIGSKYI